MAGEVGCVVGRVYTSFTGFFDKKRHSAAGTVQMCLTGRLLERAGFAFWDLGQDLEYKLGLGAKAAPRAEFLALCRGARGTGLVAGALNTVIIAIDAVSQTAVGAALGADWAGKKNPATGDPVYSPAAYAKAFSILVATFVT